MKGISIIKNMIVIVIMLAFLSCSSKVSEPLRIEEYDYELSKTEAKQQAKILLDETITILLETIDKRLTATKNEFELIKKKSSATNFYLNGWYIWQDNIYDDPFGENKAYNASYLSKMLFNKSQPNIADTTKSKFSVHTKFGFLDNSVYGDEVNFKINTLLLAQKNYSFLTQIDAEYNRHWVANYDGEDSDLRYNVYINSKELYYRYSDGNKWLDGTIYISMYSYLFSAKINKESIVKISFYKDDNLIDSYNLKLDSLLLLNNILKKQNNNAFPGASSVEERFIKLLTNFPNSNASGL